MYFAESSKPYLQCDSLIKQWLSMAPELHTTVDVEKTFARAETAKPDPVEMI